MTKENGDFCATRELQKLFGELDAMNIPLSLDQTALVLDRSFKDATKLQRKLSTGIDIKTVPLMELPLYLKIFMSKHEKYHKILVLACQNF